MRVLITGGAGYIGSHTAKVLSEAGVDVVVLDNLSTGHRWAARWGEFIEGDLADARTVRTALTSVDGVIHFAASAYVGESIINPQRYFQNNVANSLNLLNAMIESDVRTLVFSSSCATYGVPIQTPILEDHPQNPINPYGESKKMFERILRWYENAYGLRWMALRYFNAAGADPDCEIGEAHNPETHLIPLCIAATVPSSSPLQIFGTDYDTQDGTAVRDFVHVKDLAAAHISAITALLDGVVSQPLNLGSGRGYSVRQIIGAVNKASGRSVPVVELGRREGDPPILVADSAAASRVLGWKPKLSDIETIIDTAVRWHKIARITEVQFS